MKIDHIAIWTTDLEASKDYYTTFFGGKANKKYSNRVTLFESYFISFIEGARLELMSAPVLHKSIDEGAILTGFSHIAFGAVSEEEVDSKAKTLREAGFQIVKGPRITGDGYYEFETLDPDGNIIEVTAEYTRVK